MFTQFSNMGANTRQKIWLMCIIQNMSKYYIKDIPNANLIRCKVMKLAYTRKNAFNVNGTTIHFTLAISFLKKIQQTWSIKWWKT
jgi:hypothetical protein